MGHLEEHSSKGWLHVIKEELMCHLPYAVASVIAGMMGVGLLMHFLPSEGFPLVAHRLFHGFHFLHILFAGTGIILTFRKYSDSFIGSLLTGLCVPTVFCTLSDAFLPYYGGRLLDLPMTFHWCFRDHLNIVLPFLLIGILNGWVMSRHSMSRRVFYTIGSHLSHIFISSMASILYLASFGLDSLWNNMGILFVYMIIAVLIPCTLSDVIVPIFFATRTRIAKNSDSGCACSTDEKSNARD